MGLLDLFKGKKKAAPAAEARESVSAYNGMRVEVLSEGEKRLLFVARLGVTPGGMGQLQQLSRPTEELSAEETVPVRLRGYQEDQKKAIHFAGDLSWVDEGIWRVEGLRVTGKDNDRAFFRQAVNVPGEVAKLGSLGSGAACRVLNISAGGVCLQTEREFEADERLSLRLRLLPEQPEMSVRCEVRRDAEKRKGLYEYGCRFTELNPASEDLIARSIMEIQRQRMKR